jgi:hypothetical protein
MAGGLAHPIPRVFEIGIDGPQFNVHLDSGHTNFLVNAVRRLGILSRGCPVGMSRKSTWFRLGKGQTGCPDSL